MGRHYHSLNPTYEPVMLSAAKNLFFGNAPKGSYPLWSAEGMQRFGRRVSLAASPNWQALPFAQPDLQTCHFERSEKSVF